PAPHRTSRPGRARGWASDQRIRFHRLCSDLDGGSIVSTLMIRNRILMTSLLCLLITAAGAVLAQRADLRGFVPVSEEILANPSPDDWLMFSRTYDAQRFSPLKQSARENVSRLHLAFSREMTTGT